MKDEKIEEIRELEKKANVAPWHNHVSFITDEEGNDVCFLTDEDLLPLKNQRNNAELIVEMRNEIPNLLQKLDEAIKKYGVKRSLFKL